MISDRARLEVEFLLEEATNIFECLALFSVRLFSICVLENSILTSSIREEELNRIG